MRRRPLLLCSVLIALACGSGDVRAPDVEVRVETVALDEGSRSPVVILEELRGARRLPIWIGLAEAHSIADELREVEAVRPNTHDLAKRLIDGLEGEVERVVVTDLAGGIYYARIVLVRDGRTVEIDSRPSDAIAIALRVRAPVFVAEPLFEKAREGPGGEEGRAI
jgi:hypothetical protein